MLCVANLSFRPRDSCIRRACVNRLTCCQLDRSNRISPAVVARAAMIPRLWSLTVEHYFPLVKVMLDVLMLRQLHTRTKAASSISAFFPSITALSSNPGFWPSIKASFSSCATDLSCEDVLSTPLCSLSSKSAVADVSVNEGRVSTVWSIHSPIRRRVLGRPRSCMSSSSNSLPSTFIRYQRVSSSSSNSESFAALDICDRDRFRLFVLALALRVTPPP